MCDCYVDKCPVCGQVIPIHLGDFATDRDEISVFCEEHATSQSIPGGRCGVFSIPSIGKNIIMFYLTLNAWDNREMNHPNIEFDFLEYRDIRLE